MSDERLLTQEEIADALQPTCDDDGKTYYCSDTTIITCINCDGVAEAQLAKDKEWEAKTTAEYRELGLLLGSRIGGVDEFNDWSNNGLRKFRQNIMPVIRDHCEKLKTQGDNDNG